MQNQMPVLGKDGSALRTAKLACLLALPIIVLLALFGATPAHATTEPEWHAGGAPLGKKSPWPVVWSGQVTMRWTGEGITLKVRCQDTAQGTVASKGAGEITSWKFTECVNLANCESGSIKAEELPWTTQLSLVEGKVLDNVLEKSKYFSPAFKMLCPKINGYIKWEDSCFVPSLTMSNTTNGLEGYIDKVLKAGTECSEHNNLEFESKQIVKPEEIEGPALTVYP